jgi:hypothetical protein
MTEPDPDPPAADGARPPLGPPMGGRDATHRHLWLSSPQPFLWPDLLLDLGPRRLVPFTKCAELVGKETPEERRARKRRGQDRPEPEPCDAGTWISYGGHPLCLPCAKRRSLDDPQQRDVCPVCRTAGWWLSHSGRRVCRRCHSPAPGAERRDAG